MLYVTPNKKQGLKTAGMLTRYLIFNGPSFKVKIVIFTVMYYSHHTYHYTRCQIFYISDTTVEAKFPVST